jgi:hypothetical protein
VIKAIVKPSQGKIIMDKELVRAQLPQQVPTRIERTRTSLCG